MARCPTSWPRTREGSDCDGPWLRRGGLTRSDVMGLQKLWFEWGCPERLRPVLVDRVEPVGPDEADLAGAHAVLAGSRVWDRASIESVPGLRVIARTGIGVDSVDLVAATRQGVLVCNTPDGPTVPTAEHAVMLLLAAAKNLKALHPLLKPDDDPNQVGTGSALELDGRCLGLVGYGRIGQRVAAIAKALGMEVVAHDPFVDHAEVELLPLEEFWPRCDAISLHAPLTDDTRCMVDAAAFAAMRPGVILVNTARGGLVDHEALMAALDDGTVRAAGLDVTDPEPLPFDHPLWQRREVMVTPHVASATVRGRERMVGMAVEQVLMALAGERPTHLVNPEVLESPE